MEQDERWEWIEARQRIARRQRKSKLFRNRNPERFREFQISINGVSAPIDNEGICTKRTTEEREEEEATAAER